MSTFDMEGVTNMTDSFGNAFFATLIKNHPGLLHGELSFGIARRCCGFSSLPQSCSGKSQPRSGSWFDAGELGFATHFL